VEAEGSCNETTHFNTEWPGFLTDRNVFMLKGPRIYPAAD